jgi:hypothetical protein
MAKRKYITRYVKKARRGYRARKGLLSGNIGNIAIGAGAGFISPMIPQLIGPYTNPVVFAAAGYYFKKPALLGIAGYEFGRMLGGGALGQVSGGGGSQV